MAKVRRANVILDVEDAEVDRYISLGYSLIDEKTHEVLQQGIPNNASDMREAYFRQLDEIKALKEEIATLKSAANSEPAQTPRRRKKSAE